MATSFKFRYSGSVVPTEEVTLDDGTDVSYNINSNLDKTFGSSFTRTIGAASSKVATATYLTTTDAVALSDATILNSGTALVFLFVRIVSAGSTGTPEVGIAFTGGTGGILLTGVGDFCILPCFFDPDNVTIVATTAAQVANIELLVGTV